VRTRVSSIALFLLVFILLSGLLAGCGGGGNQSGNGGSQGDGAPGEGEQQQGGAAQEDAGRKIALGTVVSVKPDRRRIVLRPTAEVQDGERVTFKVRKNAEITLDNKEAEMADVKEGQRAQIEYIVKNELNRARSVALISGGQ
jgi:hypothetical protein